MITWGQQDLTATTNADWDETLVLGVAGAPLDIAGADITMQLRRHAASPDPDLTLATGAGLTIQDAPAGKVGLHVEAAAMARIGAGVCVFDVVVEKGGNVIRPLQGRVCIIQGVTVAV